MTISLDVLYFGCPLEEEGVLSGGSGGQCKKSEMAVCGKM
jgi:hypothetical protein